MFKPQKIKVQTADNFDIVDIIKQVSEAVGQSGISAGAVILFNGSGEYAH